MAQPDLAALFKLHQADAAIVEIRKRAAALDPGRALMATIETLEKDFAEKDGEHHRLRSDLSDAELSQKGIEDKIKKFDKELYGGTVVNPKEVEAIQKEIKTLKGKRETFDGQILELWEQIPKTKVLADGAETKLKDAKKLLAEHQEGVRRVKSQLEAEFKQKNADLPALVQGMEPGLLKQYNAIKERASGIGMAEVTERDTCGRCGMSLPARTLVAVREDKVTLCETCHRILFKRVPGL